MQETVVEQPITFPIQQPKKKILAICDNPATFSGVGIQARFLFEGLVATGKYTFICLGAAIKHGDYSNIRINDDIIIKPIDGFGSKELLRQLLLTEKPDAIFIFTDPRQYIWLWEVEEEIHQVCPIVYWHVWDNDPYPAYNDPWYHSTDTLVCLSHKTYGMVKEHHPEKTIYIPHAFPKQVYHKLQPQQIKEVNEAIFKEKAEWFKVLWVNRNAHRKMGNDVLQSWKVFLNELQKEFGHRNAVLYMHTQPKDPEGPDLIATADMLGLQGNLMINPQYWDFPEMNRLYNAADVTMNISRAEGFGLSTLIAMSVGRLIIANKTGGMIRQVTDYRTGKEYGVGIEPAARSLIGTQTPGLYGTPYIFDDHVNTNDVAKALMKLYKMTPAEREKLGKEAMEYTDHEFNFHKVVYDWDKTLQKTIADFKDKKYAVKKYGIRKIKFYELNKAQSANNGVK